MTLVLLGLQGLDPLYEGLVFLFERVLLRFEQLNPVLEQEVKDEPEDGHDYDGRSSNGRPALTDKGGEFAEVHLEGLADVRVVRFDVQQGCRKTLF